MKPTQTGYYWLAIPYVHLVDKQTKWLNPEIVFVCFNVPHGKKTICIVSSISWKTKLEDITAEAKWSEMLLPPNLV
jgi:hypothetical protein